MRNRHYGYLALAWIVSVPYLYAGSYDSSGTHMHNHDKLIEQNMAQPVSRMDDKIKSKIQEKLGALPWDTQNISVDVQNGRVTLRGNVGNYDQMSMVEEKISDIEGITIIDNQLEIQNSGVKNRWENRDYHRH